jgi:hypothetical protein
VAEEKRRGVTMAQSGNTVIFVGGTSYSGSTFFDMILSNDPEGFSCGEVSALFNPYRHHHVDPICGCGDDNCNIWKEIYKGGEQQLYANIFRRLPNVKFVVDSSKNPFWIDYQSKNALRAGIDVKHILIWKTPLEFALSVKKRKVIQNLGKWEDLWINYHRDYLALGNEFRSIRYRDLACDETALQSICNYIGMHYNSNKKNYWDKAQHTLFGSNSARVHLSSTNYKSGALSVASAPMESSDLNSETTKPILVSHRTIYYNKVDDLELKRMVDEIIAKRNIINSIEVELKKRDIQNEVFSGSVKSGLKAPALLFLIKKYRFYMLNRYYKYKYALS